MKKKPMLVLFVPTLAFTGSVLADDPAAARTVGDYMKTQTALNGKFGLLG